MNDTGQYLQKVTHITVDAIGEPGRSVFFLQAQTESEIVSIVLEKVQVETIRFALERILDELTLRYGKLDESDTVYQEEEMRIRPPLDPRFRTGEIGFGFHDAQQLIILMFREVLSGGVTAETAQRLLFACTRAQIAKLMVWAGEVVQRGKILCPYCNQLVDATHICSRKN